MVNQSNGDESSSQHPLQSSQRDSGSAGAAAGAGKTQFYGACACGDCTDCDQSTGHFINDRHEDHDLSSHDDDERVVLLSGKNARSTAGLSPSASQQDNIFANDEYYDNMPLADAGMKYPALAGVDVESGNLPRRSTRQRVQRKFLKFIKFLGPAVLISVGYIDPGNWATDIDAGSTFGYRLLWVLLVSNIVALVLQSLSAKLGLVTGRDLAQACALFYGKPISLVLWVLAELAIAATDLAEVIGTAIGLNLLFGLPLIWGVLITALDTFLFLALQQLGHRVLEVFVLLLMAIISFCFVVELFFSKPDVVAVLEGFMPSLPSGSLPIITGIVGAVVMPHSLYLHSGLVISRRTASKKSTERNVIFAVLDSLLSLNAALFVNSAILIVSAATFFGKRSKPAAIQDAYVMLERYFGKLAAIFFGIALLCSGQASTITGTLAGELVMQGFLNLKVRPWIRRLITRSFAIIPAVIVILVTGDDGNKLLVWSQIVLSLQLPFAMIPLIRITSNSALKSFKNGPITNILAWIMASLIIGLNVWLVIDAAQGFLQTSKNPVAFVSIIITGALFVVFAIIIMFVPLRQPANLYAPITKEGTQEGNGDTEIVDDSVGPAGTDEQQPTSPAQLDPQILVEDDATMLNNAGQQGVDSETYRSDSGTGKS